MTAAHSGAHEWPPPGEAEGFVAAVRSEIEHDTPTTLTDHGRPVARVIPIDPDQAWFWTDEWQAGEREADEYQAAHMGETVLTEAEFLADLRAKTAAIKAERA